MTAWGKVFVLVVVLSVPLALLYAAPEVYFSPGGGIQQKLVTAIDAASHSLDAALFELSSKALISALKRAGERGVEVRLVLDEKVLREHPKARALASASNVSLRTLRGRERKGGGMMHNKFAVFDGTRVETGSYNWSQGAEFANYENALFVDDPQIVQSYQDQFAELWGRARQAGAALEGGQPFPKHKVFHYPAR